MTERTTPPRRPAGAARPTAPSAGPTPDDSTRRPAAQPVRPRPRGRPPRRRRDRPLRAAGSRCPGTKAEQRRRARRSRCCFLLAGLAGDSRFVVVYIWWPWQYEPGTRPATSCTRRCSALTLGVCAARRRLRHRDLGQEAAARRRSSIQDRHDGAVARRRAAAHRRDDAQHGRRDWAQAPAAAQGASLLAGWRRSARSPRRPLVGGLIKKPTRTTSCSPPAATRRQRRQAVRLVREDGTPIRPEDVSVGGQMTVFPGIPGGATTSTPTRRRC